MVNDMGNNMPMDADAFPFPPGHAGDEPHLTRDIMRVHQALMGAFSRQVGMPAAKLKLLRHLAVSGPDGVGVLETARQLGVNAAAVTRLAQQMEGAGLMSRGRDPRDARRVVLRLTRQGADLFGQMHARAHEFERGLSAGLSDADLAAASRVLEHVRLALEPRHPDQEERI